MGMILESGVFIVVIVAVDGEDAENERDAREDGEGAGAGDESTVSPPRLYNLDIVSTCLAGCIRYHVRSHYLIPPLFQGSSRNKARGREQDQGKNSSEHFGRQLERKDWVG